MVSAVFGVLIQDQKFDRSHGGHKQRHGLALAAGENAYLYIHLIFQSQTQCAEAFTVKIDPLFIFSRAQIKKFALIVCQCHVFCNRHRGAGAHSRILVDTADAALAFVFCHFSNILIADADRPFI